MKLEKKAGYPLSKGTFSEEEIIAAKEVLDSHRYTMGEKVAEFEQAFAKWTGAKHALMVNSGSSANLIIAESLLRRSKVNPPLSVGDEVLVPALSWPTTIWPILQLGLVPVFVDITPGTLAIDLESAQSVLTPKTKAMFLIHVLGQVANMDAITAFCKKNNLILIEDTCESLGAHFNGVHAGNFGHSASYSCYFSHHISTIEGGMVTTSDSALYDDFKSIRSHGWVRGRSDEKEWASKFNEIDSRFMFIMAGYNLRPTEIQGAIGLVQMRKLDGMLDVRADLARQVNDLNNKYSPWMRLVGSEHLKKKATDRRSRTHSWMTLPFLLSKGAPIDLATVKKTFESAGVETRPIIAGNMAHHPAAKAYKIKSASSLKNADMILENGFMIGCHTTGVEEGLSVLEDAFQRISKI